MTLPFPDLSPDHPANKLNPVLIERNNTQFAPKLTFADRCTCLALHKAGVAIPPIAIAYGVNRRTVAHIISSHRAYKDVKREFETLGLKPFIAKYVTEEAMTKINNAKEDPEVSLPRDKVPPAGVSAGIPNVRARMHAGITLHRGPGHEYSHRIEILWCQPEGAPEGWYSKMLDVEEISNTPFGDAENQSHLTSASALRFAKTWLDENA